MNRHSSAEPMGILAGVPLDDPRAADHPTRSPLFGQRLVPILLIIQHVIRGGNQG